MLCPRCDRTVLAERAREGISIDVCARCRGVWLDRGELEKLLARATREFEEFAPHHDDTPPRGLARHPGDDRDDVAGRPYKRKRPWFEALGELFD